MEHVRQDGHLPSPQGRPSPIADEGTERVGDYRETDGLDGLVEQRAVLEAVASLGRGDASIGEDGLYETWSSSGDIGPERVGFGGAR